MAKPTKDPSWDTNGTNSTNPAAAEHANGYADNSVLPADECNYMFAAFGEWLAWLSTGQRTVDNVTDGILDSDVDDCFTLVKDGPCWEYTSIDSATRNGAAAARLIDTDGLYVVWNPDLDAGANDDIRVYDIDGASGSTITPSLGDVITSLMCDGDQIWSITDNDDLFVHQYDGTQLGTAALGATSVLLDCSQGYCLLKRSLQRYADLYDNTGTLVATYDTGAGGTIQAGRICESLSAGGDPNYLLCTTTGGPVYNITMVRGDTGVALWNKATGLAQATAMWLSGSMLHMVYNDAGTMKLLSQGYNALNLVGAPTALASPLTLGTTVWTDWVATPNFLIGFSPAVGDTFEAWTWDGRSLGEWDMPESTDRWWSGCCDGCDLLVVSGEAATDEVHRVHTGRQAPTVRVYDTTDWKPWCHSQAIAQGGI
jgi:hypothetical protein